MFKSHTMSFISQAHLSLKQSVSFYSYQSPQSNKMNSKIVLGGILLLVLLIAVSEAQRRPNDEHCDCHYQPDKKGCVITRGPDQAGFKCRCRISRFFLITHCIGTRIGCNTGENCPVGCASQECCKAAGGDCNGY